MNKESNMYTNVYRKLSGKVKLESGEIDYDSGEIEYNNNVYDLYTGELKFHILEFDGNIGLYYRPEVSIEHIVLDITLNNLDD
jgi:hypothetical protein